MRLLLRADVDGVGKKGDLVEVKDGFARNYLVPRGYGIKATPGIERQAEAMRRSRTVKDAADRAAAEEIAKVLVPAVITVSAKAGAEGKLFGSVTTQDVVTAVQDQTGIELDRRLLVLDEPIKQIGSHAIGAKLHGDVEFQITVDVVGS
jgi:large subunit ribosomal protein L9